MLLFALTEKEGTLRETIWCASYLVFKTDCVMQLLHRFTFTDSQLAADARMRSVIEQQKEVTNVIRASINPLDRSTIFKSNLAVFEVARALENFGYTYVHAANGKSALFLLRKQLLP